MSAQGAQLGQTRHRRAAGRHGGDDDYAESEERFFANTDFFREHPDQRFIDKGYTKLPAQQHQTIVSHIEKHIFPAGADHIDFPWIAYVKICRPTLNSILLGCSHAEHLVVQGFVSKSMMGTLRCYPGGMPIAPAPLRFFFDFISPYAYLAWRQIYTLAVRHGWPVEPVPVLFPDIETFLRGEDPVDRAQLARWRDLPASARRVL